VTAVGARPTPIPLVPVKTLVLSRRNVLVVDEAVVIVVRSQVLVLVLVAPAVFIFAGGSLVRTRRSPRACCTRATGIGITKT
jgi:hypothetical protein